MSPAGRAEKGAGDGQGHGPGASAADKGTGAPDALPLPVFVEFLRRLHDGPPQHAAAVRVALAVWQGAVERGDHAGTQVALRMVRGEMDRLIASIATLQETGRRWSGNASPSHDELCAAARAAQAWEDRVSHAARGAPGETPGSLPTPSRPTSGAG